MGRVDEAMRRAAENRPGGAEFRATAPAVTPASGQAARVAFPSEVPHGPAAAAVAAAVSPKPVPAPKETSRQSVLDHISAALAEKVVVDRGTDSASREQYRKLAATLHAMQAESGLKVVMVVSAVAGEGKTLTAANLALTFSESYQRNVLLIDADLRKPSMHEVFALDSSPGLTEGLANDDLQLKVHAVSTRLAVVTAGRPTNDPMEILASDRMHRLIEDARQRFDWVILDTPPVGLLSDARLLAAAADGAVLVVRADSTPYERVQRAAQALGRDRILGVVLNRATSGIGLASDKYSGYYAGKSGPRETS